MNYVCVGSINYKMVTFFCNNCGDYLKKKQGEMHGYCNDVLSCNDCKKDIKGYEAIRAHTTCNVPAPVVQKKPTQSQTTGTTPKQNTSVPVTKAQAPVSNGVTQKVKEQPKIVTKSNGDSREKAQEDAIVDLENIEWDGFRTTLRRIVKRHPNKEVGKLTLKKKLRLIFDRVRPDDEDEYDSLFEQKLKKTRNIQLLGDKVRYIPASN